MGLAMSTTFEFADGGRAEKPDTRTNSVASWTREDLDYAILAFCKTYTPQRASEIFYRVCGKTHPRQIPPYAYGTIIAALAKEITGRPFRGALNLRLPSNKDDA